MSLEEMFGPPSCAPVPGTFSFRSSPFPAELSTRPEFPPDPDRERTYEAWCRGVAQSNGLGNLEWIYGRDIKGTLVEVCSSIVVRSEHQFTGNENRLCLRKHLYERDHPRGPYFPPGDRADPRADPTGPRALDYDRFDSGERFGRYLGFIDLRWHKGRQAGSPLALGVLGVPSSLVGDPAAVVLTGEYGRAFGGPLFPSSVYSMADPETGGAMCAQACIIMALGMLSDRGARVVGSHTLTFLASPRSAHAPHTRAPGCIAAHRDYPPESMYLAGGLNPPQIFAALASRAPDLEVSPALIMGRDRSILTDRLVTRLIVAHLEARFPVILAVDADEWTLKDQERTDPKAPTGLAHAVVAIGYRRHGPRPDDVSFLIHDPDDRPFIPKPRSSLLPKMRAYNRAGPGGEILAMIPVADRATRTRLHDCVEWLRGPPGRALHAARSRPGLAAELDLYLADSGPEYDLKLGLVDPRQIGSVFQPPVDVSCHWGVRLAAGQLPGRRYWYVAGLRGGAIRHLWFFDAEAPSPELALALEADGAVVRMLFRRQPPAAKPAPPCVECPEPAKPARGPEPTPLVAVSVLTSCSTRPLAEFVADVVTATHAGVFDLMVLREIDFRDFERHYRPTVPTLPRRDERPRNRLTRLLGGTGLPPLLAEWYDRQFARADRSLGLKPERRTRVAALATYLPWLSAVDDQMRREAVLALRNAVLVALHLVRLKRMRVAVVETTCGTVHDPCWCRRCGASAPKRLCHVSRRPVKRRILLASLKEVVADVRRQAASDGLGDSFAIALELEPGATYLLNGVGEARLVMNGVRADPNLAPHVGLNLDVSHMRLSGIPAEALEPLLPSVAHAHASDHPRMLHTRDLPVGSQTPALTADSPYLDYLRLLGRRMAAQIAGPRALPFSGACAIELEGVDRTDWVYNSIPALRHAAAVARSWA